MAGKALYNQVKEILKRIPAIRTLLRLRSEIQSKKKRIRELSDLIKENRIATFHPYLGLETCEALTREMIHDVVKEWFDLYGLVYLRKSTIATLKATAGTVLLYVPQALLRIPSLHEEYLKQVRQETRTHIRKATSEGYDFREFDWNAHLDEVYEINTSKEIRNSMPMLGWYKYPVQPRYHSKEELQYRKYYGAFKDGKLRAYLHFWVCGDFAIIKHILGHAQHLKYGIMNGLISYTVRECIETSSIRWLDYGVYQEGTPLGSFKKQAGFQKSILLLDLESDRELRKDSQHAVKTLWRI